MSLNRGSGLFCHQGAAESPEVSRLLEERLRLFEEDRLWRRRIVTEAGPEMEAEAEPEPGEADESGECSARGLLELPECSLRLGASLAETLLKDSNQSLQSS